jgi:hypothetical protein
MWPGLRREETQRFLEGPRRLGRSFLPRVLVDGDRVRAKRVRGRPRRSPGAHLGGQAPWPPRGERRARVVLAGGGGAGRLRGFRLGAYPRHPPSTPSPNGWAGALDKLISSGGFRILVRDQDLPATEEDERYRTGSGEDPRTFLGSHFAPPRWFERVAWSAASRR